MGRSTPAPTPPYQANAPILSGVVAPGQHHVAEMTINSDENTVVLFVQQGKFDSSKGHRFLLGYIRYADDVGDSRMTAFCYQFDFMLKRFVKIDDPEYTYSD
jgi:hypothetical protein